MSGRAKRATQGQLALMDALVFFMIALTVSSILLYYGGNRSGLPSKMHFDGQCDPGSVLDVVLRASVGKEINAGLGDELHIAEDAQVAECLLLELDGLVEGMDPSGFQSLNEAILDILDATCSPVMYVYLIALHGDGQDWATLLTLPNDPPTCENEYAGSAELSGRSDSTYLIELVMTPAALSEVV